MTKSKSIQHQHLMNNNNMVTADVSNHSPIQRYRHKIQILREHHEKALTQLNQKSSLYEATSLKLKQDLIRRHQANKNKSKRTKRPQSGSTNAPMQKKRVKKSSITASSASGYDGTAGSIPVSENNALEGDLFDNFSVDDITGPLPDLEVNDIENVLAMFDVGGEMNCNLPSTDSKESILLNKSSEPLFPPADIFDIGTQNSNNKISWQENIPYSAISRSMPAQNLTLKPEDSVYPQFSSAASDYPSNSIDTSWQQKSSTIEMFPHGTHHNIPHSLPYFSNYNQFNNVQPQQKPYGHSTKTASYYENQNMHSMSQQMYSTYHHDQNQVFSCPLPGHLENMQNLGQSSHDALYQRQYSGRMQENFQCSFKPGVTSAPPTQMNQMHGQSMMMNTNVPLDAPIYSQYHGSSSHIMPRHPNYPGLL